jgi:hypothetical protein
MAETVRRHVSLDARILHTGCGNSTLGIDMHRDGYGRDAGGCAPAEPKIINLDISPTVMYVVLA